MSLTLLNILEQLPAQRQGLLYKFFLILRDILIEVLYELKELIVISLNEYCWFHSLNQGFLLTSKHVGLVFKFD